MKSTKKIKSKNSIVNDLADDLTQTLQFFFCYQVVADHRSPSSKTFNTYTAKNLIKGSNESGLKYK